MEKTFHRLKLGVPFNLSCDAKNAESVSWKRVGSNKPVSDDKELRFNANFDNQGSYVCTAIGITTVKSEPQVLVISGKGTTLYYFGSDHINKEICHVIDKQRNRWLGMFFLLLQRTYIFKKFSRSSNSFFLWSDVMML